MITMWLWWVHHACHRHRNHAFHAAFCDCRDRRESFGEFRRSFSVAGVRLKDDE